MIPATLAAVLFLSPGLIEQERKEGSPGPFRWARKTVESAPTKTAPPNTVSDRIRDAMPGWLRHKGFLLEHWQWLGLLALIFLGILIDFALMYLVVAIVLRKFRQGKLEVDRDKTRKGLRPVGIFFMGAFWWATISLLGLPPSATIIFLVAIKFMVVGASVWALYRVVDVVCEFLTAKAAKTASKFDDLLIPLVRKSLKFFIATFGIVFIAGNIPGLNIGSILAGVGLGGLAFALAAQDTVKNLFGSITVLADRPFNVGDWVKLAGVEGTVEEVGVRSTRIRTFYNSVVTIPNSMLITATVDNMGARRYRRWYTTVGVTYDTPPDKIEAFCEGIRELVRVHPYTRKDYYQVYLNEFGAASLNIMLYIFHDTPDWSTELRERHRLMLDIIRLAQRLGVEFAFPTQTLYLKRPESAGEPPPHPVRQDIRKEMVMSRREARAITVGELGELKRVPPPVDFTVDDRVGGEAEADA